MDIGGWSSWILRIAAIAAVLLAISAHGYAAESPDWWKKERGIYASFALSGAGGPLMKFPSEDIRKKLKTFEDLPVLLDDARKLGCNCIYLIDYWEGGYEMKGEYIPRADLGGPEAFKKGVEAVHKKGGKIILYLEAFIIHRQSRTGEQYGKDWAMMDEKGNYYTYYGRDRFYLMYPGEGSGWTDYIVDLAERMTRDYGVDGFHLDSYGLQWDWKDYHPRHPGAENPRKFNEGAVKLVKTMRERVRKINPDSVIILEGCELTPLLDVCDGGQLDSAAWQYSPMKTISEKAWAAEGKYRIFTSHFSLEEMEKILAQGHSLSLAPWWFTDLPKESDYERMRRPISDKDEWKRRIVTLWHWDNLLYANGMKRPSDVDLFKLRRDLEAQRYRKDVETYDIPEYWQAVEKFEPLIRALTSTEKSVKTPAEYLKEIVLKAVGDGKS